MALEDSNGTGMYMPVAPAYGGQGGFGGGFGGDWGWIVLLLLLAGNGGWGMGGFGGFGGGLGIDFPWLLTGQNMINANTNSGFDHAATQSALGDIQTSLCSGFAGVNATVNCAQNAISQQLYVNQISDLERSFAAQTASTQGMSALQAQLAQCCCENREAGTANTQAILDKLCQLELSGKNDRIADLERQLTMANLAASQTAQTSRILADNAAQTVALEQYLNPVPIPAYIVQNPACCSQNYGCGCGA